MSLARMRIAPFPHQEREFTLHGRDPARAFLWGMRTGKSKEAVDQACDLHEAFEIDGVVVVAPNGVHTNWARRQVPAHTWEGVDVGSFVWRTRTWPEQESKDSFRRALEHDGLPWFCFNSETLIRKEVRALLKRIVKERRVLFIADESHDFRKPGSKRSMMMRPFSRRCPYRRILTGTAVLNSPLHAWSQFEMLEHGALGFETYAPFEARYAEFEQKRSKGGQKYNVIKAYHNLEELRESIARWSSIIRREDVDMKDPIRSIRDVEPSDEQVRLFRQFQREFVAYLDNETQVSIGERTARWVKLQQIFGGYIIDERRQVHDLSENPRLEALSDEVSLTDGKIIIWCQYQEDIRRVRERLVKDGVVLVEVHGKDGGDARRQENIDRFQKDPRVKVVLGQYQAGGSGLELSAADTIINYTHSRNTIAWAQSQERASLVGGKQVSIVDFVAPGPDEDILRGLQENVDTSAIVMAPTLRERIERMRV